MNLHCVIYAFLKVSKPFTVSVDSSHSQCYYTVEEWIDFHKSHILIICVYICIPESVNNMDDSLKRACVISRKECLSLSLKLSSPYLKTRGGLHKTRNLDNLFSEIYLEAMKLSLGLEPTSSRTPS